MFWLCLAILMLCTAIQNSITKGLSAVFVTVHIARVYVRAIYQTRKHTTY